MYQVLSPPLEGPGNEASLELALIMKKKERKIDKINGHFYEHLVLACTIVLMNDFGLIR